MENMKIYISVQGGVVSDVRIDEPIKAEVEVIDYDADDFGNMDDAVKPYEKIKDHLYMVY